MRLARRGSVVAAFTPTAIVFSEDAGTTFAPPLALRPSTDDAGGDPDVRHEAMVRALAAANPFLAAIGYDFDAAAEEAESTPLLEAYGFARASVRIGARASFEILSPIFDTCGPTDPLEALTHVRVDRAGHVSVSEPRITWGDGSRVAHAFLGPTGERYDLESTSEATCRVRTHEGTPLQTFGPCGRFVVGSSSRHTVVLNGVRVLRLRGAHAVSLGEVPPQVDAVDIRPDSRGRALVLSMDGALYRLGQRETAQLRPPTD